MHRGNVQHGSAGPGAQYPDDGGHEAFQPYCSGGSSQARHQAAVGLRGAEVGYVHAVPGQLVAICARPPTQATCRAAGHPFRSCRGRREQGESPLECIRRELREEAGLSAG
ncbi:NUDIX domain-containing protein [Streptomyces sp. NPDC006446]|uniref:NUDIX domain-containing protein n=1 Tax=Streptomyces sp. NPDC006446 TaxID=3154301 RepID=UPI0033AA6B22